MRILFATIAFPESLEQRNIYTDLMEELRDRGHEVYVIASSERRRAKKTGIVEEKGIHVLRVRTLNLQKCHLVEKGLATLLVERQYRKAIEEFWGRIRFDLVLYSTPPITLDGVVRYVKARDGAKSYLLLKDIFPQNAVDIGMMKAGGILHRYFRSREKRLYALSDYIGCMSQANVEYLEKNNPWLVKGKAEVCSNSVRPLFTTPSAEEKAAVRGKYGIPQDSVLFVYGGNLGKPQGVGFIERVLEANRERRGVFFLVVGSGTEYDRLEQAITSRGLGNARIYPNLPKADYDRLLAASDVGLIFLDSRFTIPNFPSRLLGYMEQGKPVLAATDRNTDLGKVIVGGEFGFWCESGDLQAFNECLDSLAENASLREKMGNSARRYLLDHYTVGKACDTILGHFTQERVKDHA